MRAKFARKMQNSITIDTKWPAIRANDLCPCFAIVMIFTLWLIGKKKKIRNKIKNFSNEKGYFTLFTAPRAHCVDERRSTCSSCSMQRAVLITQMVFANNAGSTSGSKQRGFVQIIPENFRLYILVD